MADESCGKVSQRKSRKARFDLAVVSVCCGLLTLFVSCGGPEPMGDTGRDQAAPARVVEISLIKPGVLECRPIGRALEGRPVITDLAMVDLDQDGLMDVVVCDAGDIDGDGEVELVTGGLHMFPPFENMSRILLWDRPE